MPDDLLDLRLRTATALNLKTYYEEEDGGERYYFFAEGEREHQPPPDYPHNLGACVEVLAAIEARGWEWELSCTIRDNGAKWYCMGIEKARRGEKYTSVYPISEAEADSRPAAICEAFCQAVEASGARREAADNA